MTMDIPRFDAWCSRAVKGIRYHGDRKRVLRELLLLEKRDGPFVLLSGAYVGALSWYAQQEEPLVLPLILFDRHPKAIQVELTIGSGDITLTSIRDGSGWFRFDLDTSGFGAEEYQLLQSLHTMTTRGTGDAVRCTARFYGAAGDLIAEETI